MAAARVIDAIGARNAELAGTEHPWVGAETYFLGEVHGGDFYNRFPTECRLVGTRRWAPGNTLEAVEAEFLRAARADRRRDGLLDRARPQARPRRLLDRPRARALAALRAGYRGRHRHGAAADGDQGRRRRGGVPGRGGDPDRLPRPCRQRRARGRRVRARCRARPRDAGLPDDASAPLGSVSSQLPSYEELRTSFRWELPAVVNIGVEVCRPPAADGAGDPRHRRARDHAHASPSAS